MKKQKPTTKFCKYCKTEIPFSAKICPQCRKKQKSGGCLNIVLVFFVMALVGSCFGGKKGEDKPPLTTTASITEKTTAKETTEVAVEETTASPQSPEESFIDILTKNPNVTTEAAKQAYSVLTTDLGFQNVSAKENNDMTLFEINGDDYALKITVSDKLYMIICGDFNMYKDDTIIYTKQDLEDRKIGNNDSTYYTIAKEAISQNLKSPSSARFCSLNDCQMARKKDIVAVKGYVDAVNSFNAEIRNEFVVEFKVIDLSTYSYEVVYININGETSGTYIDLK